jgi:hypothetical protein
MLGQHPNLYGLPEVNLFAADHVRGLLNIFKAVRPASLYGLWRTIAELEFGQQTEGTIEEAKAWLEQRSQWRTGDLYHHIARRVSPRRLVDKSPLTVMNRKFLERMFRTFPDGTFLHLTRHPRPTCRSILQQIAKTDRKRQTNRAENTDPEHLWRRAHNNVLAFGKYLPTGQMMRLKGEELLAEPHSYLPQIETWLEVESSAATYERMMHPENSTFARLGPVNAPFGNDPNFLSQPHFQPRPIPIASLEGPIEWRLGEQNHFTQETIACARRLGYQ